MLFHKKETLNKKYLKKILEDSEFLKKKDITIKDFTKFLKTNNFNTTEYFIKYIKCHKKLDKKLHFFQNSCKEATNPELYLITFIDEIFEKYIGIYFSDANKFRYNNTELKQIVDCIDNTKDFLKNSKTKEFYTNILYLLSALTQYKGESYSALWYKTMDISLLNKQYFNKTIGFLTFLIFKEISWLDLRYFFDIESIKNDIPSSYEETKQILNISKDIETTRYDLTEAYAKHHNNQKLIIINKIVHKAMSFLFDEKNPIYHDFDKLLENSKQNQQEIIDNQKTLLKTLYFYTYWEKISLKSKIHSNNSIKDKIDKKSILSLFKDFNINDISSIIKNICQQKKFIWELDIDFDNIKNFEYAFKALYYISRDISQNSSSLSSLHNLLWDECGLKDKDNINKLKDEEGFLIGIDITDFTNFDFIFNIMQHSPEELDKYKMPPLLKQFMNPNVLNASIEKKILFCEQRDYVIDKALHKTNLKYYTNENLINLFATKDTIHIKKMRILEQHGIHFTDQFLQEQNFTHFMKLLIYTFSPTEMIAIDSIPIAIAYNFFSPLLQKLISNNFNIEKHTEILEKFDKLIEELFDIHEYETDKIRKQVEKYSEEHGDKIDDYSQNQETIKWFNEKSIDMYKQLFEKFDEFIKYLEEIKDSQLEYINIETNKTQIFIQILLTFVFGNDTIYEKISSRYSLEIGLYIQHLMYKHCPEIMYKSKE